MAKNLSEVLRAAASSAGRESSETTTPLALATLKKLFRQSLISPRRSKASPEPPKSLPSPPPSPSSSHGVSPQILRRLREAAASKAQPSPPPAQESVVEISKEISSEVHGEKESNTSSETHNGTSVQGILDIPWFSNTGSTSTAQRRKEVLRERKKKYIFKNTESRRFSKLMRMCAEKLGTESTLEIFGKLGRETGIKEYNSLIKLCIDNARNDTNEEGCLDHIHRAYHLLISMKERGLQIKEESYGPLLIYMIDKGMADEFQVFSGIIRDENPESFSRLGYYEMLLWIRAGDENKIQELCSCVGTMNNECSYKLAESYLLAFCETDRKTELLQLLEVLDISKISSLNYISTIFKSLGRLQLENLVEKLVLALKNKEVGDESISSFIHDYVVNIPNLAADEVVSTFRTLNEELGVIPSIMSYDKLIILFCKSLKVRAALDVAKHMCESGLVVSVETFHQLLHASEQSCDFDLVRPILSLMCRYNLKPKGDTFRIMICLLVKMKDFEGAYNLLTYAEETNEVLTASMYNTIMAGCFREKDIHGALLVLKQMEGTGVKPDSETYSYLIANSEREEDVNKYCDEMQHAGVQVTKHVYMALINAYANFGKFEMAKQVVLDQKAPVKFLNEIKSVLVSALSSHGRLSDALNVYDEIKQAGCTVEPKAVISLIEHIRSDGGLGTLLQLLEDLKDSGHWFDGCSRVILYCARHNLARSAVDLLKKLSKKDKSSTYIVLDQLFCQLWESEPVNVQIGLDFLRAMREELDVHPSRTSLDFLLSTCVKARDGHAAQLIWLEYGKANLPYNALTFLRMYQALLASDDREAASEMLKRIPKDDPHVCYIIKSCEMAYKGIL